MEKTVKFVTYSNGTEVLITTLEDEKRLLKDYFSKGGRCVYSYDRQEEADYAIAITPKLSIK